MDKKPKNYPQITIYYRSKKQKSTSKIHYNIAKKVKNYLKNKPYFREKKQNYGIILTKN